MNPIHEIALALAGVALSMPAAEWLGGASVVYVVPVAVTCLYAIGLLVERTVAYRQYREGAL